jgi:hypothetical protein
MFTMSEQLVHDKKACRVRHRLDDAGTGFVSVVSLGIHWFPY